MKYKKEKGVIYVACPPLFSTGGTELLHQLVFHLNESQIKAEILYVDVEETMDKENLIHKNFKKYIKKYVLEIDDEKSNLLIVPETSTQFLYKYKNIQKCIWWLSIDNYFKSINWKSNFLSYIGLRKKFLFGKDKNDFIHFCQSIYAKYFLERKGIKDTYMLSDYLNESFLIKDSNKIKKRDIALYNPKKGIDFTNKLIQIGNNIEWVPIQNMTPQEVVELMRSAKVYIDFGEHPGKDRIPREAAMCNCCIITGKNGSAAFKEDVNILDEFKFARISNNIPPIIEKIQICFDDFENETKKFDDYRQIITSEKELFLKEINSVFTVESKSSSTVY